MMYRTLTPPTPMPPIKKSLWHRIEHLLGWNFGYVDRETIDGVEYVCHRCAKCGETSLHTRSIVLACGAQHAGLRSRDYRWSDIFVGWR